MVVRKEGQLLYAKLPTSEGNIADYPTALFLVKDLGESKWVIARPWLEEDTEEDLISPVKIPEIDEQLAYECVDITGLRDRITPLADSVLIDFSDQKQPNPFTPTALIDHIPAGLLPNPAEFLMSPQAAVRHEDDVGTWAMGDSTG